MLKLRTNSQDTLYKNQAEHTLLTVKDQIKAFLQRCYGFKQEGYREESQIRLYEHKVRTFG